MIESDIIFFAFCAFVLFLIYNFYSKISASLDQKNQATIQSISESIALLDDAQKLFHDAEKKAADFDFVLRSENEELLGRIEETRTEHRRNLEIAIQEVRLQAKNSFEQQAQMMIRDFKGEILQDIVKMVSKKVKGE